VAEVCRKPGISARTFYAWKSNYAGVTASDLTRMRGLEAENVAIKDVVTEPRQVLDA